MLRVPDNLVAGAFFDDLTFVHHRDALADMLDDRHVVGDEEVGQSELFLKVHEQVDDLRLDRHIERGGRLITDDELGFEREGASDPDALTLTTRELVRIPIRRSSGHPTTLEQRLDAFAEFRFVRYQTMNNQWLSDDRRDAHAWVE